MPIRGYGPRLAPGRPLKVRPTPLQIQHDGQIRKTRQALRSKIFCFSEWLHRDISETVSHPQEGRFAIVTNVGCGCDGRGNLRRYGLISERDQVRRRTKGRRVRRSRVVLAPRSWRQVGGKCPADDGGKRGRSPGRSRISRKAIARGKPGCLGCTCQIRVRSLTTHCTRCCGRSRRPAFPAPSNSEGASEMQNSGDSAP